MQISFQLASNQKHNYIRLWSSQNFYWQKALILFICIFLTSNGLRAESYSLLKKSESGGLYYVDGSFDKSGREGNLYPTLTILINNKNGYTTPNGKALSMMVFLGLNCPNRLQVTHSTLFYSGYFSEGTRLLRDDEASSRQIFRSIEEKFCPPVNRGRNL